MISCLERYSEQFLDICKKDFICTGYVCGVCGGGRGIGDCKGWCVSLPGRGRLVARTWTCHPYCHRLSHVAELAVGLAVPSWLFLSFLFCCRSHRVHGHNVAGLRGRSCPGANTSQRTKIVNHVKNY